MTIGMAVNSGNDAKKAELSELLEMAANRAIELGLWVDGRPFDVTLRQISKQLAPEPEPVAALSAEALACVMERARLALAELANDGWGSESQVTAENEFGNVVESLLTPERFAEWETYCLHATSEEIISSGLQALGLEPIK